MNRIIIGDKNYFAIEREIIETQPYFFGKACLWIGGMSVGCFEDTIILPGFTYFLSGVVEDIESLENPKLFDLSNENIYFEIYDDNGSENNDTNYSLTNSTESFDDFYVIAVKKGSDLKILWKLREKPCIDQYPNYPRGVVFSKVIDVEYFKKVATDKRLLEP